MVRTFRDAYRGRLVRRLRALTAATAALFPSIAHADNPSLGAGVFVGYTFGPRHGLEWGLEAFATHRFRNESCFSDGPRSGIGPLLQFGMIGLRDPRLTLAAQGGTEITRYVWAVSGELGATYRFGSQPGFGIHTGLSTESLFFNVAGRYQWLLDDAWLGGGIRVQPTYGDQARCEVGRPLRVATGVAELRHALLLDSPEGKVDCGARDSVPIVGAAWERDASSECASVVAFLHLAEELLVHGAPDRLVEDALDAACDEIRHAELCAHLASRHLGCAIWPVLPTVSRRADLPKEQALLRFAKESWEDGAIAEGAAARRAEQAATVATDEDARFVQSIIARDEHRHAELGWKILEWAIVHGGNTISDAVRALRDDEVHESAPDGSSDRLEQHGRLSRSESNRVLREHVSACQRRLDRVLGCRSRTRAPLRT